MARVVLSILLDDLCSLELFVDVSHGARESIRYAVERLVLSTTASDHKMAGISWTEARLFGSSILSLCFVTELPFPINPLIIYTW